MKNETYLCKACNTAYCGECEKKKESRERRKELGKWALDISKYVATAVIITTFLGGIEHSWLIYLVGFSIAILSFIVGFYFMNNKK